jgi:hypothetical protein
MACAPVGAVIGASRIVARGLVIRSQTTIQRDIG